MTPPLQQSASTVIPATEPHGGVGSGGRRIPALDGLRGIAITGVMLLHFTLPFRELEHPLSMVLYKAASIGWMGVDLFFVLSGFLITGILADARGTARPFRTFYTRRALRILPLYYGFLLLLFGVPWLIGAGDYINGMRTQLPYWVYLQNFGLLANRAVAFGGHLWSLAIEEQFYLLWPIVILLLPRRLLLRACALFITAAIAYRCLGVLLMDDIRSLYFLTPGRIDGLVVGAAIALLMRTDGGLHRLRRIAPPMLLVSLGLLAGAAFTEAGFSPGHWYILTIGFTALALAFGAMLVLALNERSLPARVLSAAPLRFVGRYSYGLYVLHLPLAALAELASLPPFALQGTQWEVPALVGYIVLMGAVSVLAALASWHFLEEPFLRLRNASPPAPLQTVP